MNKVVLVIAIFVSSIFADTIYLKNGQEIKDAVVTEIGDSDVKYKIGERQVVYTAKKWDLLLILYEDGTKEVFNVESPSTSPSHSDVKDTYENFTAGQRWGTWGLNWLVPGIGSIVIMSDWAGAVTQWVLVGGGLVMVLGFGTTTEEECFGRYCTDVEKVSIFSPIGLGVIGAGAIFNIIRSATYDKPKKVAYNRYEGFNFAVLPNRHGSFMPYLTYNKTF